MVIVREDLKQQIKKYRIDRRYISSETGVPYSRLNQYLNGFSAMPTDVEREINNIIKSFEKEAVHK